MLNRNRVIERKESFSYVWLFVVICTSVLALLINILSLQYGRNDVAPNLFYIPVVIAAYWYPNRAPLFTVIISFAYLAIVYVFMDAVVPALIASLVICCVLIGVSLVVSNLVILMRRNEVKYRGLFDHSQAGVGLVDLATKKISEVNHRFSTILGYPEDEIIRIPFGDLFMDPDRKELFFRQMKQTGSIENFEARFKRGNTGNRWMLVSAGMLPYNQFVTNIIDITDRKNAELDLLIKDHAISSSINAIAILDLDLNITYVNQSLLRLMDCPYENKLIGKSAEIFASSPRQIPIAKETLRKDGCWSGEMVLLKYTKVRFHVLFWMNIVRDETGAPICIMAFFIDITDRKQMEVAKRKALEQIEKNIEQFAILGDHIRNPLAVIVGLSSLTEQEIADKIILQVKEIDRIVTQLDIGWIESENVRNFIKKYYMVGTTGSESGNEASEVFGR